MDGKIKVAVLVEGHPYDVVSFQNILWSFEDCDCFVQPLDVSDALTTDNANSIKTIGLARMYKNSRVFCYASGHDHMVYDHASFRKLIHNGLRWCTLKS